MTIGLGVPAAAGEQVGYVEHLADAGAAGLTIAERLHAPPLTPAMVEAAERLAFPILFTGYEIPFIAIERAVADASRQAGQERLTRMLRLYETVRRAAVEGLAGAALVDRLAAAAACRAFVVDPARGAPLLPGAAEPPPGLAAALAAAVAARPLPLPAVLRLSSSAEQGLALPVPARRPASLLVLPDARGRPDPAVLEHVATIAALELEKLAAERERDRRLGAELLAHLVDGRVPSDAPDQLSARGLGGDVVLAACARSDSAVEHRDLHHRLGERGVPHLLLHRGGTLLVLLPATQVALAGLLRALDPGALAGASNPFDRPSRAADAAREARWALEGARTTGEQLVRYGERTLSPFMPRTLSEAHAIVGQVLGPLHDYDQAHGTDLLGSLATFLSANRSWQRAAAALRVHKQTLVYRMRRVEELTGRRLDRTEDVAELWLALRTREAAGSDLVRAR
jgi:purine catabolism regulator